MIPVPNRKSAKNIRVTNASRGSRTLRFSNGYISRVSYEVKLYVRSSDARVKNPHLRDQQYICILQVSVTLSTIAEEIRYAGNRRVRVVAFVFILALIWWVSQCYGEPTLTVVCQIRHLTLEPDGTAAACKAAFSGFDSHRRLFQARFRCRLDQRRPDASCRIRIGVFRTWTLTMTMSLRLAPD